MPCKPCIVCKRVLDVSCFGINKMYKDGVSNTCKQCVREASVKYRKEYPEKKYISQKKYSENNREVYKKASRKHSAMKREFVLSLKTNCQKCGEQRKYLIQFHHIDTKTKLFNIGALCQARSKEAILNEVKKCVCLCSNCHDEFHYLYGIQPENPKEAIEKYLIK